MQHLKSLKRLQITADQVKAERARRSLYRFLVAFWDVVIPDKFIDNWHIHFICAELQGIAERVFLWERPDGEKRRLPKLHDLIINVPPGTSKSTICTVVFPAWLWTNDATIRVISGSYSGDLALSHSVKSRDIIQSEKFRRWYPNIEIKEDVNNKSNYQNTQGGERIATSVGGTVTGQHAHIIIVDDPLNAKQGASAAERKTANDWMTQTLSTRKVDKAMTPTILVMQRLHTDDCTGHLLSRKGESIRHICLPAELSKDVKPAEAREMYQDGLLDANRLGRPVLAEQKKDLGSYGYAGQMQQRPVPEGGGIWRKEWFIPVPDKDFPAWYTLSDYGTDWDTAYTANQVNDASAYCTSGSKDGNIFIDKIGYVRKEFPELVQFMMKLPRPHYIEAKASGKSARQTLVRNGVPAIEVIVEGGDKVARTRFASPSAEAGMVYVRESILDRLLNDAEQGLLHFPNGTHDDVNDAVVQAIQRHTKAPSWII